MHLVVDNARYEPKATRVNNLSSASEQSLRHFTPHHAGNSFTFQQERPLVDLPLVNQGCFMNQDHSYALMSLVRGFIFPDSFRHRRSITPKKASPNMLLFILEVPS